MSGARWSIYLGPVILMLTFACLGSVGIVGSAEAKETGGAYGLGEVEPDQAHPGALAQATDFQLNRCQEGCSTETLVCADILGKATDFQLGRCEEGDLAVLVAKTAPTGWRGHL